MSLGPALGVRFYGSAANPVFAIRLGGVGAHGELLANREIDSPIRYKVRGFIGHASGHDLPETDFVDYTDALTPASFGLKEKDFAFIDYEDEEDNSSSFYCCQPTVFSPPTLVKDIRAFFSTYTQFE